jgi:hypothetical protein
MGNSIAIPLRLFTLARGTEVAQFPITRSYHHSYLKTAKLV